MDVTLLPIVLATSQDSEAQLVFVDERLIAVLVRLSSLHAEKTGWWFLETGYGAAESTQHPSFRDLEAAVAWIKGCVADNPRQITVERRLS